MQPNSFIICWCCLCRYQLISGRLNIEILKQTPIYKRNLIPSLYVDVVFDNWSLCSGWERKQLVFVDINWHQTHLPFKVGHWKAITKSYLWAECCDWKLDVLLGVAIAGGGNSLSISAITSRRSWEESSAELMTVLLINKQANWVVYPSFS